MQPCIYTLKYPAFSDLGDEEILLDKRSRAALVLLVHPDYAPKDEFQEKLMQYLALANATQDAYGELQSIKPNIKKYLRSMDEAELEFFPLTMVFAEVPTEQ